MQIQCCKPFSLPFLFLFLPILLLLIPLLPSSSFLSVKNFKDCLFQCRGSHVCANSVKESGVDQKKIDEKFKISQVIGSCLSLAVVSCWPCNIVNSFFFFLVFFFFPNWMVVVDSNNLSFNFFYEKRKKNKWKLKMKNFRVL